MNRPHRDGVLDFVRTASGADSQRTQPIPSPAERETLREDAARIKFSRDLRRELFNRNIFGEPAWDMLLALYVIDNDRRRLSVGDLYKRAGLPQTTALRWLDYLDEQGLIKRRPNALDQRMTYVELSDQGRAAMDSYFQRVRGAAVFGPIANGR